MSASRPVGWVQPGAKCSPSKSPGPAVKNVPLSMAPEKSRKTIEEFGRPEYADWIAANPTLNSKREIARAFGIKGAARIDLKRILKELEAEGHLEKRQRSYADPDRLPRKRFKHRS